MVGILLLALLRQVAIGLERIIVSSLSSVGSLATRTYLNAMLKAVKLSG